jgi:hypothetical protein
VFHLVRSGGENNYRSCSHMPSFLTGLASWCFESKQGARDALPEEANKCMLIRIEVQLI